MLVVLTILISIACVLLTLVVLIQNPKGGGLGASLGGFNNQIMGVQRTTDFLEKATWTLAGILIVFSLLSKFFTTPKTGFDQPAAVEQPAQPQQQPQGEPLN